MSKYTYAEPFKNPTEGWMVIPNPTPGLGEEETYIIGVPIDPQEIISAAAKGDPEAQKLAQDYIDFKGYRPHTAGQVFKDAEEADEYLYNLEESFEEDYDQYLDENRHEIVQMERYEQWRNEY